MLNSFYRAIGRLSKCKNKNHNHNHSVPNNKETTREGKDFVPTGSFDIFKLRTAVEKQNKHGVPS